MGAVRSPVLGVPSGCPILDEHSGAATQGAASSGVGDGLDRETEAEGSGYWLGQLGVKPDLFPRGTLGSPPGLELSSQPLLLVSVAVVVQVGADLIGSV